MGMFFIHTSSGTVATRPQLEAAGLATATENPPRPWLQIKGTIDASTLWYAILRKRERGIFIGTLVIRHSDHYHLLISSKEWEEVPVEEIQAFDGDKSDPS